MTEVVNAIIKSAEIRFDRGVFLTCWINLDFGGTGQGFGGYVLGGDPARDITAANHKTQPNIAADFIAHCMVCAGVENFSDMKGKVVRVERNSEGFVGEIFGIGHAVKDFWYRPAKAMKVLKGEAVDQ